MKISSENMVYQMSPENKAVFSCSPGDTVIFETKDCFSNQLKSNDQLLGSIDFDRINPATGPLEVKGASPGDTLKIGIKQIKVAKQGVMVAIPEMGIVDRVKISQTKVISVENGQVNFSEKIKLPLKPMIGVIGVAPADRSISCGTPGSHGGNMDCKVITAGTNLYLPVKTDGALLALGDLHAVMGDGEVVVCGVEISGEVTLKVDLITDKSISDPIVETSDAFYTIASAPTLDEAAQKANNNMFAFLQERLKLKDNEIAMLMSIICDLQVCQVVDPEKTARMRVDKEALRDYNFTF